MLSNRKIQKILIDNSYVKVEDIAKAQAYAKSHKSDFLSYLFDEGILSQEILGQAVAEHFGVKYIKLADKKISENILQVIPEVMANSKGIVAFEIEPEKIHIGMTDPEDIISRNMIQKKSGLKVIPYYTTELDIESALLLYRSGLKNEFTSILESLKDKSIDQELRDELMVGLIDLILKYGYENKASDIHVEPFEKGVVIRFRIDGMLHDVLELPKKFLTHILTRIKVVSGMRTDEHHAAQDGKFRYEVGEDIVDVRVSILPVTQGENVVMRLLSSKVRQYSLTDLGLSNKNLKVVKHYIENPHGMILVTGPTGSGKTTTLYAVLKMLNRREVNIATIEDPVEYDIEGISQIQVNNKTKLTFAKGLRSIVRQDPDIIMIGEIRDEETAGIAVNAALTGHLVLSTLHTNDAATALPRLLDMKVESFLVSSTINMIVSQRLVRKICSHCKQSYTPTKEEITNIKKSSHIVDLMKKAGANIDKMTLYKGVGCKACGDSGYIGRIGIFEILEMNEEIKELVVANATADKITAMAKKCGMQTIIEDGIEKIVSGATTIEEVLRVTMD